MPSESVPPPNPAREAWIRRGCCGGGVLLVIFGPVWYFALHLLWFRISPYPDHPFGYAKLMSAIEHHDVAGVRRALDSGIDPNDFPNTEDDQSNEDNIAPLDSAAYNGDIEVVRVLLDHGADPNLGDGDKGSPLAAATNGQHLEEMDLLVARGAKVNDVGNNSDSERGSSALWTAAMDGHTRAVGWLLNHGAMPDTRMGNDFLIAALKDVFPKERSGVIKQLEATLSKKKVAKDPASRRL